MDNEGKNRLLLIKKILCSQTDSEHPLTTAEIIDILERDYGIACHRITVTRDIECLQKNGVNICKIRSSQNRYYISESTFDTPEIMLLANVAQSAAFVPFDEKEKIRNKIKSQTSKHISDKIDRSIALTKHVGATGDIIKSVFNTICSAIDSKKKISFKTYKYGSRKDMVLQNNGEAFIMSPYDLLWDGKFYFVLGYCDNLKREAGFRIDKIAEVPEILNEEARSLPFGTEKINIIDAFALAYDGTREKVELICDNDSADAVIDFFGDWISVYTFSDSAFKVIMDMPVDNNLFGWVFAQKGKVRIKGPESVKNQYADMLRDNLMAYGIME